MVEYSEKDFDRAKSIINALFNGEDEFGESEQGLSVFDIQQHVIEFQQDIELIEEFDGEFPAFVVKDDLEIPVSLSLFGYPWSNFVEPYRSPNYGSIRRFLIRELLHEASLSKYIYLNRIRGFVFMPIKAARKSFVNNATKSLACRIAAVRQSSSVGGGSASVSHYVNIPPRIGGAPTSTPGCLFTVTSNSPGLRVFWSGAYYLKAHYFGSPTSPTTGILQSGTYVFGVDGGVYGNIVQWDENAVCSLPGVPYVHLNY